MTELVVAGVAIVAILAILALCVLHYWQLHAILNRQANHVARMAQANLALAERPQANLLAHAQEQTEQMRVRNEAETPSGREMSNATRARNFAAG